MSTLVENMPSAKTTSPAKGVRHYFHKIGVSVLFSGAAVGVSHVVQATRAGADFSLALLPTILLCLLLKYPAFLFGPLYTTVTGESVVRGYSRIGKWTLPLVAVSFLCVMFTVVSAVALLSAGIALATTSATINITALAIGLIVLSTILSLYFSYQRFQEAMKVVFFILVSLSVFSLAMALPQWRTASFEIHWTTLRKEEVFFIAALIGWMPAGLDLPMMHSQWLLAKGRPSADAVEDFNFGYLSTTVLAVLFLVIGAVFFYGTGTSLVASAGGFSRQLLDAYTNALGNSGRWVIGITLFLAIFSTLAVVVDGFPRVLSEVLSLYSRTGAATHDHSLRYRQASSWTQFAGATVILLAFTGSLTALVDFATIVSFLICPIFAFLNHRITSLPDFRAKHKVSRSLRVWSLMGILFFTLFTLYYFYLNSLGS
ncbi:MAG: divalent metal cation transporter [Bdellovibrionales bacterium]|nr:divalent metal cation transporter [Bdellovibrionales bacterium]